MLHTGLVLQLATRSKLGGSVVFNRAYAALRGGRREIPREEVAEGVREVVGDGRRVAVGGRRVEVPEVGRTMEETRRIWGDRRLGREELHERFVLPPFCMFR